MLVVALTRWGLRAGEVVTLHEDQPNFDTDEPHIQFDEQKDGSGTVSIAFGEDMARQHIAQAEGYLFPSERSQTSTRTAQQSPAGFTTSATRLGFLKRPTALPGSHTWADGSGTTPILGRHKIYWNTCEISPMSRRVRARKSYSKTILPMSGSENSDESSCERRWPVRLTASRPL